MKYKQICPECYREFEINSETEMICQCPNCKSRKIRWEKLIKISSEDLNSGIGISENKNASNQILDLKQLAMKYENNECVEKGNVLYLKIWGVRKNKKDELFISKDECPVILGRSAKGNELFSVDLRVGNEHCYINFVDGKWCVKDNRSRNSTQLNGIKISSAEYTPLCENDILKLGNTRDAFEFKVEMKC